VVPYEVSENMTTTGDTFTLITLKEKLAFSISVYGCGKCVIGKNHFMEQGS
jgi:hypothetical protein